MATKKAGSAAKKSTSKKSSTTVSKPTTTEKANVTTVKAVETTTPAKRTRRFGVDRSTTLLGKLVAEFVGTFILAAVIMVTNGQPLYVGFALVAIVLLVGAISGAHVNPLVTIGAWVTRKMSGPHALAYVAAQFLGGALALTVLSVFYSAAPTPDASQAMLGQSAVQLFEVVPLTDKTHWYVFFAELIGGTILAFAVATAQRHKTDRAGVALGVGLGLFAAAVVASGALAAVQANAVINPAVAFFVGAVSDWGKIDWFAIAAYGIAPVIGGVLGFALQDALHASQSRKEV